MKLASFNALMYNNNNINNNNNNIIMDHLEERPNSSNSGDDDSPSTTNFTSISSPKRRQAIPKKVVMIPIKDLEGSKFKSDCTPPSDSWAWRKYGQKPIKGSPYPRGYYRCSSSKGCPARKQVERSRSDPTMLVVTYSHEHNHPGPASRNHHNRVTTTAAAASTTSSKINNINPKLSRNIQFQKNNNNNDNILPIQLFLNNNNNNNSNNNNNDNNIDDNNNNMDHLEQPLNVPMDELTWLSTDHEILQNDFIFSNNNNFLDMSKLFPMREEDESFFGDLGELPEYPVLRKSTVIVGNELQYHQQQQQYNPTPTPWCGSIG